MPGVAPPSDQYDAVIVGGGPAGIFAALEFARQRGLRVLLLEQGTDISARHCPARETGSCLHCSTCDITTGWGGAGAFSDGKLTLSTQVGGWLGEYLGEEALQALIRQVDHIYMEFGAPDRLFGDDADKRDRWGGLAARHGLHLVCSPVRHMGTENAVAVLSAMRTHLEGKVEIRTDTKVVELLTEPGLGASEVATSAVAEPALGGSATAVHRSGPAARTVTGVRTADGEVHRASAVIVAPGRQGAGWLTREAARLGIPLVSNAVDIGVRVEVPAAATDAITDELYEPKLLFTSRHFEDQVRTFCMNPHGTVCTECWGDAVTVNGHSYAGAEHRTESTNFALLVSTRFTEPFDEPITYGKHVARLANMLGKDILVQRLGDLRAGRRTTTARLARSAGRPPLRAAPPGALSFGLPYRHLRALLDMLDALDALLPGVGGRDTLLYGVEVKFYSSRLALDSRMETPVAGLYAIGDGAGVTRGLVQASASGLVAARAVMDRVELAAR